ncbi:hypothetical protein HY947_06850 [Candidatus Gottesmanbacteria bacterium]|nr:hypothetical protein [Candidatus Gottesmanbacteria bacterium]
MFDFFKRQPVPWIVGIIGVLAIATLLYFALPFPAKQIQSASAAIQQPFAEARAKPVVSLPKTFPKVGMTDISGKTAKGVDLLIRVIQRFTGCDVSMFSNEGTKSLHQIITTGSSPLEPIEPCSPAALTKIIKGLKDPALVTKTDYVQWLNEVLKAIGQNWAG